jgi:hypothetical protein
MTAALVTPAPVRSAVRRTGPSLPSAIWLEVRKSLSTRSGRALVASATLLGPAAMAVAAAGGHVLSELRPLQRGLEDVFFSLTAA